MQQIQVLPVQSTQGSQQIIMQPNHTTPAQAQTAQVIQTADGQTLIYQPVQVRIVFVKEFWQEFFLTTSIILT